MAGIESEALALLVVRLDSDQPAEGDLCWHRWHEAAGAEPHGLSEDAADNPHWNAPFKRLPTSERHYFSAHVEQMLFPSPERLGGGRWVCCPDDLYLECGPIGKPGRIARVELLERLSTPLDSSGTLGLIHLSLCPTDEEGAPSTLSWCSAIRSPYINPYNRVRLSLLHGDREVDLERRPLRRLAEELFGDPHDDLDRHLYTVLMTTYPDGEPDDPAFQREWLHALAIRSYELSDDRRDSDELEEEREQTVRIAGLTGLVLGSCTVFAAGQEIDGKLARSFRSYWAESLVFGLLQRDCIEEFQRQLAALGLSPHKQNQKKLEALHGDWLAFRNLLWWSQLSTGSTPPQELLALLRRAQGTDRLFVDLEGDMVTYSDLHHRELEDRQAAALANLQVYGSPLVVLGTLATLIGLLDASGALLAVLIVAACATAFAVFLFVSDRLDHFDP